MFHFKQFSVDQTGCAMKINTDGVLLGSLTQANHPQNILDIGTGTGVVALMLAQRFTNAQVDAVEIDGPAAKTAEANCANSPFSQRLKVYHSSFQDYFKQYPGKRYTLIVSNPPFYINSLQSPGAAKTVAKHADAVFFDEMLQEVSKHLLPDGLLAVILPDNTAMLVKQLAVQWHLHVQQVISIKSYSNSTPHRELVVFSLKQTVIAQSEFVIYSGPKQHSAQYRAALQDFFTIFP